MEETQIAKENVEWLNTKSSIGFYGGVCKTHKQTLKRWLGFLKKFPKYILLSMLNGNKTEMILNKLKDDKITDLKQAIKLYEENGI